MLFSMDVSLTRIVPVTKARNSLKSLTDIVQKDDYVVLTKGGVPKAALVDIDYLTKLQQAVAKLYQKTFLSPKLLPYTRIFTKEEIEEWEKADAL